MENLRRAIVLLNAEVADALVGEAMFFILGIATNISISSQDRRCL